MSIEDELGKDLEDLLREAVRSESNEERLAYYPGKVVDNKDPIKKGRCRIRVFGIYGDSIGDDDLPWADNDSSFNGSEVGSFVVPPVGALVNVRFNGNDFNLPRYTSKVVASPDKMVSNPLGDYPDTMVFFETDSGDYFKINRKTGETNFNHRSGVKISISKSGDVEISNTNTDGGEIAITSSGNLSLQSKGDILLNARGNVKLVTPMGSEAWTPNCLKMCPFTMLPHGGPLGGIIGLKGSK